MVISSGEPCSLPSSTRWQRQFQLPSLYPNPPLPRTRPPVIEAVAIGRGLVDEADVHIIGDGEQVTAAPYRSTTSDRARRGGAVMMAVG